MVKSMSLQDKISSAKPNTFLTDGLSEEEVEQAVDEGRRRSMKLIIDIDDEQVLFDIKNRSLEAETETDKVIINALYSGIPLDDVKEEIEQDMSFDMFDDYGNKTRIHKELWEIFDNIGKESEDEE